MTTPTPGSNDWLAQVIEPIEDPAREIIDPHHHLWRNRFNQDYLLNELWADTGAGHNVTKTVFMECRAFYRREGPEHLKALGETQAITEIAKQSHESSENRARIAGIVAHADLTLAGTEKEKLVELLDGHTAIAGALFKGIRQAGARDSEPEALVIPGSAPAYLYGKESFREGLRLLAARGLSYDTWHYHHQNLDYIDLANAVPECTMVLDHFGTPLGVGRFRGNRDEIFKEWKVEMRELAKCSNVYAKIGGLAMPDNGFDWHLAERPPTSDEFVAAQGRYYHHMIECFGPERCMFESNFPVDRLSISYPVLWNALKKIAARYSESEQQALFSGTASKVYKL